MKAPFGTESKLQMHFPVSFTVTSLPPSHPLPSFSTPNPGCKDLQEALDPGREMRDPGSEVEDPGRESAEGNEARGRWVDRGLGGISLRPGWGSGLKAR
jgi:hypothetical protein